MGQRTPEIDLVLSKLDKVQTSGQGWVAACPCRQDDQNPSLTIGLGREGQVLLNCHRGGGCDFKEICDSMGVKPNELFPDSGEKSKGKMKLEDTYVYQDAEGQNVMQVLRMRDEDGKKTFRQQRWEDNEWKWGTQGIDKPLYKLPEVLEQVSNDKVVYVVEGEKDVKTLERLGKVATCNPGGAGDEGQNKWLPAHTESLAGGKVIIIQDNDEAGEIHASSVAAELRKAGAKVVVKKPARGKDVSDHIAMDLTLEDLELVTSEIRDEFTDFVETLMSMDHSQSLAQRVNKTKRLLDGFESEEPTLEEKGRLVDWATLLHEESNDHYEWLIPGLLERQERVIVVAAEGVGKTFLARQVALKSAAGIHPFKNDSMEPIRTLFVDLENPERIIRRTARRIYQRIENFNKANNMKAHLVVKPDGLDLLKPDDRNKLINWVEETQPELLVLGPLYKAFLDPGGRTSESVTTEIAKFLDYIRHEYGCALWLEHHAPLGSGNSRDLRPFGSAVWSRWSEFGIAISPDPTDPNLVEVNHYRGMRDQREWPTLMRRGNDDEWPFVVLDYVSM